MIREILPFKVVQYAFHFTWLGLGNSIWLVKFCMGALCVDVIYKMLLQALTD